MGELARIPPGHGRAVRVEAGRSVRLVNTHGTQVVDGWAFNAYDLREFMSMEATRVWNGRINVVVGDVFVTNQRRPILFAVIHFGNWDILGGAFTYRIGPSMVLVDDLGHPALNRAIQDQRARLGMAPATGRGGLRQMVRHLQAKGTAAILFDRPPRPGEQTVTERLFGHELQLPNEILRIADLTNARLIPLSATRQGHELRFQPHIDLQRPRQDTLLPAFESALRANPDQWYQFRPIWRG